MLLGLKYVFISCPSRILILILLLCIQGILPAFNVFATGEIIGTLQSSIQNNQHFLYTIGIWCMSLLGVQCIQPLVNLVQGDVNEITTRYFNENIMKTMNSAKTLSLFEDKKKHEQLELLRREASYRPLNFVVTIVFLLRSLIMVVGLLYVLIKYSGFGPAICAFSVIPLLYINIKVEQRNWKNLLQNTKESLVMRYVFDACMEKTHLQEIRLYNLGNYLLKKYSSAAQNMHLSMHRQRLYALLTPIPMILLSLLLLFVGVYIFLNTLRASNMTISAIVVAFQSITMLKSHLDDMASNGGHVFSLTGFFKTYHQFITGFNDPVKNGELSISQKKPLSIDINGLDFEFSESSKKIIDNLSLNIQPGEKVAILGDNGSGKTTLLKLIMRMYACKLNTIKINDSFIENLDLNSYRKRIAAVFQEYGKYEFSVGENIAFDDFQSIDNENLILSLLSKVELSLPLENQLGKRFGGSDLSVGQWQKLAIARALYRDADLFIFDEFSSSLDPEIEYKLFNEILAIESTIIAVTHRLGKIKEFDKIIVMAEGKIIESGSFKELIALEGKFYKMWQAQFKSVIGD